MASQHNDGLSGGPPRYFAIAEPEPGIVLVGTCVRGIARSTDNAITWTPVDGLDHISINAFAATAGGGILAATSGGLWRSDDQGRSWDQLDDEPIYATTGSGSGRPEGLRTFRLLELSDGLIVAGTDGSGLWARYDQEAWTQLGATTATINSLAETPSGVILAGTHGDGVLRSRDGGTTWEPSSEGPGDTSVHALTVLDDGSILAGTGQGLARSLDDGRTWQRIAAELDSHRIFSVHQLDDGRIMAGSYAHLWIGEGDVWRLVDPGLTPDETWAVHFHGRTVYAGAKAGLLRSEDQGKTFQKIAPGSVVYGFASNAAGEVLAGGDWGVRASPEWTPQDELDSRAFAVFENGPDHLLVGTLGDGLVEYRDGVWSPVAGGPPHRQVHQIVRSASGRLLACTGDVIGVAKVGGVFTSDDDGTTWTETLSGRSYYCLTQTSDGTIYAGGRRCYISASTDNGDTWDPRPLPLGQEAKMYSLFADSRDRLFLGAGGQLLRSDDGAVTWTVLDDGIDGVSFYDIREGPGPTLAGATNSGVYTSTDGGETWQASTLG
ncbi:MAG: hypothetical protein F4011_10655 [Acidimicrobiaceae bacterium]|nr:hypothetical protein [Acidimicrobiaceae bacterium]MYG99390.1 hypothetical protein [Acidimicrobiaceae bacterium]MYL04625.1 hypothetical protein [Acidimicrobiaceae bacterium]